MSSLGYFPSLRDELLVIPTCPVITCASHTLSLHDALPISLIYDIIPFALAAVRGCSYHDKLLFCHSSLITLGPAPLLPLAATCSIAWSVCSSVQYINPNTSPKELQLSSLGYFPSLRDELLVISTHPVVTCASCSSFHSYHSRPSSRPITSRLASWLHHIESRALGSSTSGDGKSVRLKSHFKSSKERLDY